MRTFQVGVSNCANRLPVQSVCYLSLNIMSNVSNACTQLRTSRHYCAQFSRARGANNQEKRLSKRFDNIRLMSSSSASASVAPAITIVGGGFGGLYTAVKLDSLMWRKGTKPQITLIDQGERFVFKPLLYELLNGTATEAEVAPSYVELLGPTNIRFLQGKVVGMEVGSEGGNTGMVTLEGGESVRYDYLVLGLGAEVDNRGVPGVAELATPFVTFDDAVKVNSVLERLDDRLDGRVVIVGAGYAGIELAAVIAERMYGKAQVTVLTPGDSILTGAPPGQAASALKTLETLNVRVMTGIKVLGLRKSEAESNPDTESVLVDIEPMSMPASASAQSQSPLVADLVLWAAGSRPATPHTLAKAANLPTTRQGQVLTEPTLRVSGTSNLFALGDVARTSETGEAGPPLPSTAQVAFQEADYAAWNIWASINNRPLLPFRYQHLGSMMTLGTLSGALALPVALPEPLTSFINGSPLAGLLDVAGIRVGSQSPASTSAAEADKPPSSPSVLPPSDVTLDGPLAAVLRRVAYLYRQPTNERRLTVATSWLRNAADVLVGSTSTGRS